MCFTQSDYNTKKATRTIKDKFAYKVFRVSGRSIQSPVKYTHWRVGEEKKEVWFKKVLDYQGQSINAGFHCLRTLKDARNFSRGSRDNKIMRVKIPAGSHIYINKTQIVANKMTITSSKIYPKRAPKPVV